MSSHKRPRLSIENRDDPFCSDSESDINASCNRHKRRKGDAGENAALKEKGKPSKKETFFGVEITNLPARRQRSQRGGDKVKCYFLAGTNSNLYHPEQEMKRRELPPVGMIQKMDLTLADISNGV
jgi:hypothetical protein